MDTGLIRHPLPDEFVFVVHTVRELEAMATFPMLLRPGRFQIFLATFRNLLQIRLICLCFTRQIDQTVPVTVGSVERRGRRVHHPL